MQVKVVKARKCGHIYEYDVVVNSDLPVAEQVTDRVVYFDDMPLPQIESELRLLLKSKYAKHVNGVLALEGKTLDL